MRTTLRHYVGLLGLACILGGCATTQEQARDAAWLSGAKEPVNPDEQIVFDRLRNATLNPLLSLAGSHEKVDVNKLKTKSYKKVVSNETHYVYTGTNGKDFSYRVTIRKNGTEREPSLVTRLLAHSVVTTNVTVHCNQ